MSLKILSVGGRGILEMENVLLRAEAAIDLSFFLLIKTHLSPDQQGLQPGIAPAYWFAQRAVEAGEEIAVFTRAQRTSDLLNLPANGLRSAGMNALSAGLQPSPKPLIRLYQGYQAPLFTEPNARAVIMDLARWTTGF